MKKVIIGSVIVATLFLCPPPASAQIGNTIVETGKAAVLVPVNFIKFVGGGFKLVGETLLLPFRVFS